MGLPNVSSTSVYPAMRVRSRVHGVRAMSAYELIAIAYIVLASCFIAVDAYTDTFKRN